MKEKYFKFMRYGKKVAYRNKNYYLVEDMIESTDGYVSAVLESDYSTYDLHRAWIRNRVNPENAEAYEAVVQFLTARIPCKKVKPMNEIRFITSEYQERFRVKDFGYVWVNGKKRQVCYVDDYHFRFLDGCCYHICEFAEIAERHNTTVSPTPFSQPA